MNSQRPVNQDKIAALTKLSHQLDGRAAFLAENLRTWSLPKAGEGTDWRGELLAKLEDHGEKHEKEASKNSWPAECVQPRPESRKNNKPSPGRVGRPGQNASISVIEVEPRAGRRGQDDSESDFLETLEKFAQEHMIYGLVERWANDDPNNGLPGTIDAWRTWALEEVLNFYDAVFIELLAAETLTDGAALVSFEQSLARAREVPRKSAPVGLKPVANGMVSVTAAGQERRVPARGQLARMFVGASVGEARMLLWRCVHGRERVLRAAGELLWDREDRLARWILTLLSAETQGDELIYFAKAEDPVSKSSWFFDSNRVWRIVKAADAIRESGSSTSSSKGDSTASRTADAERAAARFGRGRGDHAESGKIPISEHVENLDDARTLFIQKYVDANWKEVGSEALAPWRLRRNAEDVWWRSFGPADIAKIVEVCHGAEYARWNVAVPPRGAARSKPRERLRSKLAAEKLAPSERAATGSITPKAGQSPEPGLRRPPSVTVFGAGISGLTAAHELASRGFKVVVVESTPASDKYKEEKGVQVGGLARTQWSEAKSAVDEKSDSTGETVPGEHGYRFFPSFYRHIFDTMKRTPLPNAPKWSYPTAFDQLQPTYQQVFARRNNFVPLRRSQARTLEAFRKEYMQMVDGLEFERRDLARFFFKLVRYLMTCSARRAAEYENMSFLTFLGGEDFYSAKFLQAIKAAPQALVAMDAKVCDARTQANVYLQLLMDQVLGGQYTDSTLRGPTSPAWLQPWREYLDKGLKVEFLNANLLSIGQHKLEYNKPQPTLEFELVLELPINRPPGRAAGAEDRLVKQVFASDYHVVALDVVAAERVTSTWDSHGVPSELRGFASYVEVELSGKLDRYDFAVPFLWTMPRAEAERTLRELLDQTRAPKGNSRQERAARSAFYAVSATTGALVGLGETVDEARLTLWIKPKIGPAEIGFIERAVQRSHPQAELARLISPQPEWIDGPTKSRTPRMPDERYGDTPADRLQTFTGVQYYFAQDFQLVRGHVYFPDSPWGLSAVSQSQFWSAESLPKNIRGVLSVDIGDCRARSPYTHKSFMESSPDEIQAEVWRQIEDSLRTTRGPTAIVTSLALPQPIYYHIDDNLVFARDRLWINRTPFLINNVGDWDRRPRCQPWVPGGPKVGVGPRTDGPDVWQAPHGGYRVHANKVVFCGTYMRTFTRMTTMEAANESARHAVNAILDHHAWARPPEDKEMAPVSGDYCQIWDIEQNELEDLDFFKRVDEMLFRAGKPHIADILQFDKIADLQHPDLTPGQALATALGSQIGKDWGIKPQDLIGSFNGLVDVARRIGQQLGGAAAGGDSPVQKLLAMLKLGKSEPERP